MLPTRTALLVAVLLAVTVVAAVPDPYYDDLTGPLGTVDLWSNATFDSGTGLWTYTYEMYNRPGNVGDVHVFVVDNPPPSPYNNSTNDSGFINPTWPTDVLLQWLNGNVITGAYGHFSYQSEYAPDVVPVQALAINGGAAAAGTTLGMGAVIPEPGCLAGLGSLLGMSAFYLRRRKR